MAVISRQRSNPPPMTPNRSCHIFLRINRVVESGLSSWIEISLESIFRVVSDNLSSSYVIDQLSLMRGSMSAATISASKFATTMNIAKITTVA